MLKSCLDIGTVFVHRKHMTRPFMIIDIDDEKLYFKRAKCDTVYSITAGKWMSLMRYNSLIIIFSPYKEDIAL
mgnify:CR=1 FL=1